MNNNAIGVFDSGVGGLTCVSELQKILPHEDIIYLGDTARIPYGTRSKETVFEYAKQDVAFFREHNVKMIIVACGTVSAVMMTYPIFNDGELSSGVLYPAVRAACDSTRNKRIGVIATSASIKSGGYGKAIREIIPDAKLVGKACPMFVPLVENGYTDRGNEVAKIIARDYLQVMIDEDVDTLIMGCTHYPLLRDIISDILGEKVTLISPGAEAAKYALRTLSEKDMLTSNKQNGKLELYCTDSVELFTENVKTILGSDINGKIYRTALK